MNKRMINGRALMQFTVISQGNERFEMSFEAWNNLPEGGVRYLVTGPSTRIKDFLRDFRERHADPVDGFFTRSQCDEFIAANSDSFDFKSQE